MNHVCVCVQMCECISSVIIIHMSEASPLRSTFCFLITLFHWFPSSFFFFNFFTRFESSSTFYHFLAYQFSSCCKNFCDDRAEKFFQFAEFNELAEAMIVYMKANYNMMPSTECMLCAIVIFLHISLSHPFLWQKKEEKFTKKSTWNKKKAYEQWNKNLYNSHSNFFWCQWIIFMSLTQHRISFWS